LEADIHMGNHGEPVMAHDKHQAYQSDITFAEWLEKIKAEKGVRTGIKLDWKDPAAVLPCLLKMPEKLEFPVFLNADVIEGTAKTSFNASEFVEICQKHYQWGILSLGWKLSAVWPLAKYSEREVTEMLQLCRKFDLQHVTFPVCAHWISRSWDAIKALLDSNQTYTFTVWGSGMFVVHQ